MISCRNLKLYVFICFMVFFPNIMFAQDDPQESDYERRLRMAEEFLNKNINKNSTKSDSIRATKENKKQKKDKEKKNLENSNEVNDIVQSKNSRLSKLKTTSLELLKKKKFLYGSVAIGTIALLIASNDGETKSLVNDPSNTIGPPPEWPNGP